MSCRSTLWRGILTAVGWMIKSGQHHNPPERFANRSHDSIVVTREVRVTMSGLEEVLRMKLMTTRRGEEHRNSGRTPFPGETER